MSYFKNSFTFIGLVLTIAISLSSCGTNSGVVRQSSSSLVRLTNTNFRFVKRSVVAELTSKSALCMIPLDPGRIQTRLMGRLIEAAQLGPAQELVNISIDHDSRFLLLFCTTTHTITGDVVELGKPGSVWKAKKTVTPKSSYPAGVIVVAGQGLKSLKPVIVGKLRMSVGKRCSLSTTSGKRFKGKLKAVNDTGVTFERDGKQAKYAWSEVAWLKRL